MRIWRLLKLKRASYTPRPGTRREMTEDINPGIRSMVLSFGYSAPEKEEATLWQEVK